ncbi:MAG: hypothetical protein IT447_03675 [Phycisphaerales bacterium]|nr:hypothetical protein [Phycisphaerales bacterium]
MNIFEKQSRLKPGAMATVADRRFADAQALCDTKQNAHANGAAYLAGFVIEILLKARLVKKYPIIARKQPHDISESERGIWTLIWRRHDLEEMLDCMPELEAALHKAFSRTGVNYLANLKKVCAAWTIHARYSPRVIMMDEASQFLERVRLLKEVLK